jgi:hypothetical protein
MMEKFVVSVPLLRPTERKRPRRSNNVFFDGLSSADPVNMV